MNELIPQLYLHGLAEGDFDLALRGLLGEEAPISASTMVRLKERWHLKRDWERMVTFYRFPKEHWKHLRTTNPVESLFAALRLRTDAAKRYKKVSSATAVIWKMLLVAEQRFRKLDAPEKMKQVFLGVEFGDGVESRWEEVLAVA